MVVKLYYPYTQIPCNVRLFNRRIATFLLLRLVAYPYILYVLISNEFLVDKYLRKFYGKTSANHVAGTHFLSECLECNKKYSNESLRYQPLD